jgi:hypothetical protein
MLRFDGHRRIVGRSTTGDEAGSGVAGREPPGGCVGFGAVAPNSLGSAPLMTVGTAQDGDSRRVIA